MSNDDDIENSKFSKIFDTDLGKAYFDRVHLLLRSRVEASTNGLMLVLRSVLLSNAGGALAIFTFTGTVLRQGVSSDEIINPLTSMLGLFIVGMLASGISGLLALCKQQAQLKKEAALINKIFSEEINVTWDITGASNGKLFQKILLTLTAITIVASYGCFIAAVIVGFNAIANGMFASLT